MESKDCEYRAELNKSFLERKAINSAYSLRALARDLEINPATLSQFLSGKRNLSPKNAKKLGEKLCWSDSKINQLLVSIKNKKSFEDNDTVQLQEDEFSLISNWYFLALLSMAKRKNCTSDSETLACDLGISVEDVEHAVETLLRLGLLVIKGDRLIRTSSNVRTTLDIPSRAIRRYHSDNFSLAEHALEHVPVELREISSITLNIDPDQIQKAKEMIVDFKRRFSHQMEKGKPVTTYTLGVHFYPASLKKGNGNEH